MSVPFRVMGGAWSVPGYAMKGLYQEMIKSKGKSVQNYIIAARIAQGYDEATSVSQRERDDIISRWNYVKVGIKKKRNPGAEQMDSLHSLVEEKRKRRNERWERVNGKFKGPGSRPSYPPDSQQSSYTEHLSPVPTHTSVETEGEIRSTIPSWRQQEAERTRSLRRQNTESSARPSTTQSNLSLEAQLIAEEEAEQRELERAITASVADASRGDPEEDKLIASAIRASIAELESAPAGTSQEDDEAALKRAIAASMDQEGHAQYTEAEQKALEETLRKSLLETSRRRQHGSDNEWDEDSDTEEDEEYQRIIAESKELAHLHASHPEEFANQGAAAQQESGVMDAMSQAIGAAEHTGTPSHNQEASGVGKQADEDDDDELKKALAESEKAEKDRMETLEKQRTEEDIVMEYVRKQSLLEEEHRQRVAQGRETGGEGSAGK